MSELPVVIVGVEGGLQGLTGSDVDKACLKIAGVLTSAKPSITERKMNATLRMVPFLCRCITD